MNQFKKVGTSVKNYVKKYPKTVVAAVSTLAMGTLVLWAVSANGRSIQEGYPEGTDFDRMEEELAALEA